MSALSRAGRWLRASWTEWFYYGLTAIVTTLLAIRAVNLDYLPWNVPLNYSGDAIAGGTQFKGVLENGWYEYNAAIGAPAGQHYHDFPQADNLNFVFARLIGLFTDDWAVAWNAYYVLTFTLAALAGAWFIRMIGGGRISAFSLGLLFAFAPYHFVRNEGHLYLGAYYPVPLAASLIYLVLADRPLWGSRDLPWWNPIRWLTKRTLATVAILAVLGTASSYYSVFTVILLALAIFGLLVTGHSWRPLVRGAAATVVLMLVMLVNMAPDILWSHQHVKNFIGLGRSPVEAELYALKFAQLVLPTDYSRIAVLRDLRDRYNAFPLPSERPMLGLVAAVGFCFLIVVAATAVLRRHSVEGPSERWRAQGRLAFLALASFLVGTVGGLSALFALLVSDHIRGWNRIAIFISLFAAAAVALLLDAATERIAARRWFRFRQGRRLVGVVLAGLVLAVGLYDQVPPTSAVGEQSVLDRWNGDERFVRRIEAEMPANAMVFQLPYLAYPESGSRVNMVDSELFRPYLHSTDLRWSYGSVKGRPDADWADEVSRLPVRRMLTAVAAAGFDGVYLQWNGYTEKEKAAIRPQLKALLGEQPLVDDDHGLAFFDLRPFAASLRNSYSPEELKQIGEHAVSHPVPYWQRDFTPSVPDASGRSHLESSSSTPVVFVDNPLATPTEIDVSTTVGSTGGSGVTIHWPDGAVTYAEPGTAVHQRVVVPPGRSPIKMSTEGGHVVLDGVSAQDPVLTSFTLRGDAARPAPAAGSAPAA